MKEQFWGLDPIMKSHKSDKNVSPIKKKDKSLQNTSS